MSKVVKVTGAEVVISHNEEYLKVNPSELNFVPKLILTLSMKTTLCKISHKSFTLKK